MEFWMGVFMVIGIECLAALVWYLAPLGDPETGFGASAGKPNKPRAAKRCQAQRTRIDKTR